MQNSLQPQKNLLIRLKMRWVKLN